MKPVQTNVRVAECDKALIVAAAKRLRLEPSFRDRMKALLDDPANPTFADRIKKLEQQVSWLLSGAIVVPRHGLRSAASPSRLATSEAADAPSAETR
jgi:hypothetical protein